MNLAVMMAAALSLNGTWQLDWRFEEERGDWSTVEAQVPGDAYLALHDAGVLPDLTIGTNVWRALKYEQCEWRYSRTFDAPELKNGERAELVFEGVDTRAVYSLNGEVIGHSANMFIPHRFDVTDRLKPKGNRLEVLIASPLGRDLLCVLGRSRMGGSDVEGIRKAQHSFGWDIMPRVVSGGIWRDVRIDVLPPERFGDAFWIVERVDAKARTADVCVQCQVLAPRRLLHEATLRVALSRNGKIAAERVHPYRFAQTIDRMRVSHADLWWPRSAGAPALYDAVAELYDADGKLLARDVRRIGLRTVRLERADWHSEEDPGTFRFIVNGTPVYMHGCDWTPMDALHSRDSQHLQKCLDMLVDLNCNMIRIWGGGVYEPDALYDFCDANGILVWQDFMMGNVEPEQNDRFAKAIEEEAKAQILRLRSHPSLSLWCANNEQDRSVASNWRENAPDPAGDRISREVLPRVLRDFDPFTPYIPSSPWWTPDVVAGKAKLSQDHLWGPRSKYFKGEFWTANTPTFVSETGYHGCPNVDTIKRMMTPAGVYPWPDAKNKCVFNQEWQCKATIAYPEQGPDYNGNGRNSLMTKQSELLFGKTPDALEAFSAASQHAQAEALKTWIELSRSRKGRMWGLLWWNLRDGWPILSDGVVDWYFGKKQAYAAIRQSSQDELVMVRDDRKVIAVNDRLHAVKGKVRVMDRESGKVVLERGFEVAANATAELGTIEWSGQGVFLIDAEVDGDRLCNYYLYGEPPFDFARFHPLLVEARRRRPAGE
jgi:beta-mannosidase